MKLSKSEAIARAREQLNKPNHYSPTLVAFILLDYCGETLHELAYQLGQDNNCSRNDVIGLIELMEKHP